MARRKSSPRRSFVRLEALEDRLAPALFTQLAPQTSNQLNNNGFVASGDWNKDGIQDLVLANYGNGLTGGNKIVFAYGDGTGKFSGYSGQAVNSTFTAVNYLAVGDLNNDGNPDIVTANIDIITSGGSMSVFLGSAVGAFNKTAGSPINSGGSRCAWVGIADFDKDGNQDVAAVNIGDSSGAGGRSIVIFKGDGKGGLVEFNRIDIPMANGVGLCGAIADFDGDTYPDLAVSLANVPPESGTPQIEGSIHVFKNKQDGTFPDFTGSFEYGSGGPLPINIVAGDFNGDGKPDIAIANAGDLDVDGNYANFGAGRSLGTLTNGGTGTFGPTVSYTAGFNSAFSVAMRDFDLDGKVDLVVTDIGKPGQSVGGIAVYKGKTTGSGFVYEGTYTSPSVEPQFLVIDSFNSNTDKTPDIVLVHSSNSIVTFLNTTVPTSTSSTTTALAASPVSPTTFGNPVTLSATVTATTGTPTGTVTFFRNGVSVGTGSLQTVGGSQVATFVVNGLNAGNYTFSANYDGTASFLSSKSADLAYVVNKATTTTTLLASPTSAVQGELVTFTATVASAAGAPGGTVAFFDNGVQIGTGALATVSGQQQATFASTTLAVGSHPITAQYLGAANFAVSTSAGTNITITPPGPASTTTILVGSPNPSVFGQPVTFTATVAASVGTPSGLVTFTENGNTIGGPVALTLVGGSMQASFIPAVPLTVGTHNVVANYAGATGFNASASSPFAQVVNPTPTTTTIAVGPGTGPYGFGTPVTFTATVAAQFGTAAGSVTFVIDGVALGGAVPLVNVGGVMQATLTTSTLDLGSHTAKAQFGGSAGQSASESVLTSVAIATLSTTTGLVPAPATPTTYGTPVTLTATVTPTIATTVLPTGTVTFFSGATALGTGTIQTVGVSQVATLTANGLDAGTYALSARYEAATGFAASKSLDVSYVVNKATSTTTLATSTSSATVGSPVTLTATVTSPGGAPTGTVAFFDNGVQIGTGPLATVSGQQQASFVTSALVVGSHPITAQFLGAANFTGSLISGSQTVTITPAAPATTTTTLSGTPAPSLFGQPVTFTATVAASAGVPIGFVTFTENGVPLGAAVSLALVGTSMQASFTTSTLTPGSHPIVASYGGVTGFSASSSFPFSQLVTNATTATTVVTGPGASPYAFESNVTFTATVTALAGLASGQVQFSVDGAAFGSPATLVSVGGSMQATVGTAGLPVGSHQVTAQFLGSTGLDPSGSTPAAFTISSVGTTASVVPNLTTVTQGQPVTLTATIARTTTVTPQPGGTVTFRNGTTVVGTAPILTVGGAAVATLTTSSLPVGTASIVVDYPGDATFGSSTSAAASVTVNGSAVGLVGYREFGVGVGAGLNDTAQFYNPDGTLRFTLNLFPGFTGGVRVTSADFNGDGIADLVAGTGPGAASSVVIIDGKTKNTLFTINPFEAGFTGGVFVAAGDINGDGTADLVITPDEGGGPRCRVISGAGFTQIADFFGIDDKNFRGGARAAIGDLNGDGKGDLIVSAGFMGGPRVAVYNGALLTGDGGPKFFGDFFVFEETLRNGAYVAAGDINGDGFADLIAGGGPGGGPRVYALSGKDLIQSGATVKTAVANFFAGDEANRGGIRVVARDLDGDDRADIVTGSGDKGGTRVSGYLGKNTPANGTPPTAFSFDALPGFNGGVFVG